MNAVQPSTTRSGIFGSAASSARVCCPHRRTQPATTNAVPCVCDAGRWRRTTGDSSVTGQWHGCCSATYALSDDGSSAVLDREPARMGCVCSHPSRNRTLPLAASIRHRHARGSRSPGFAHQVTGKRNRDVTRRELITGPRARGPPLSGVSAPTFTAVQRTVTRRYSLIPPVILGPCPRCCVSGLAVHRVDRRDCCR